MQVINFDLVKVIASSALINFNKLELNEVVKKAMQDKYIGSSVEWWEEVDKQVIFYNSKVIGFFCPRKASLASYGDVDPSNRTFSKSGTMFILNEYRGYRIPLYVLSKWCKENLPCIAYIDDVNIPSIKLFSALGYLPLTEDITNRYTGNVGRIYLLDNTKVIDNLQF